MTRLLGASAAIQQVREMIERVSTVNTRVLVLGESGTGKELVARSIHSHSSMGADRPFLALRCACATPEIITHVIGGDENHTGTLFLDEVTEASPEVQLRLLQALEQKRYSSEAAGHEGVRVIASTSRVLEDEVAAKRFRADLFYRLHVVPIVLPPLRERAEDIVGLAEALLEQAAARQGRPVPRIGVRARDALLAHRWPGNVRELANAMEAALLLTTEDELDAEHFPSIARDGKGFVRRLRPVRFEARLAALLATYLSEAGPRPPSLQVARAALETAYLGTVLARAGGNVTQAAKLAGRNRANFCNLLRRHGMTPSRT